MWRIRLTVLMQLTHWKLRAHDVWTLAAPVETAADLAARTMAAAREARSHIQL